MQISPQAFTATLEPEVSSDLRSWEGQLRTGHRRLHAGDQDRREPRGRLHQSQHRPAWQGRSHGLCRRLWAGKPHQDHQAPKRRPLTERRI